MITLFSLATTRPNAISRKGARQVEEILCGVEGCRLRVPWISPPSWPPENFFGVELCGETEILFLLRRGRFLHLFSWSPCDFAGIHGGIPGVLKYFQSTCLKFSGSF